MNAAANETTRRIAPGVYEFVVNGKAYRIFDVTNDVEDGEKRGMRRKWLVAEANGHPFETVETLWEGKQICREDSEANNG